MATWSEFAAASPQLSAFGEARFEESGFIFLGTTRADGWPRISPVEPLIFEGQLYLGMMWQSQKALDLLRDPRCLVHNSIPDRMGGEGEFKLRGQAANVTEPAERKRYSVAMAKKLDMPSFFGEFHLYRIDIVDVAVVTRDESEQYMELWRAAG